MQIFLSEQKKETNAVFRLSSKYPSLVVLLFRLEVALRVVARRALVRCIFCLADKSTVATLPPNLLVAVEEVALCNAR